MNSLMLLSPTQPTPQSMVPAPRAAFIQCGATSPRTRAPRLLRTLEQHPYVFETDVMIGTIHHTHAKLQQVLPRKKRQ